MNQHLHAYALARLQGRIKNKARTAGIPVAYVYPEYTSQTCLDC
ncbi:IS200/IS605 family accessory protein TnpB-related protein [Haloarcula rubripromontorii]